jgi:hypothetical protein
VQPLRGAEFLERNDSMHFRRRAIAFAEVRHLFDQIERLLSG